MNIYYIAAITAAFLWALTAAINTQTVRYVGTIAMNRWRMIFAATCLWTGAYLFGNFGILSDNHMMIVAGLSGFIGIFIGDTALFESIKSLGARRVGVLYTLTSPFTIAISFLFLGEQLTLSQYIGCLIITIGVMAVIISKDKKEQSKSQMENVTSDWKMGIVWGVVAAVCQATGIVIARYGMDASTMDVDYISFSAVRMTSALIPMLILRHYMPRFSTPLNKITGKYWASMIFSSTCGMVVGMSLVIFALKGGQAGIVSTLSSLTPIFVLPILWYQANKVPSPTAWFGAFVVVIGTAILQI
ncbi:MAG: DMT family transporter [Alphaproteobacteria bacterium]